MGRSLVGIRNCTVCNTPIEIYDKRRLERENVCCSKECQNELMRSKDLNTICVICGKRYHLKPYQKKRTDTHCCSRECFKEYKKIYMKGEGNHQYGLKGNLNDSWKSDERISRYGYRQIRTPNHPFKDHADFVFEHRLVAEQYLLNDQNSIEIDGKKYLKKEYHVHHIDFNRLNNDVSNLKVMLAGEHIALHNKLRHQCKLDCIEESGK